MKWVEDRRDGFVRSRLVAMEIAYDLRGDTHAGTPPMCAVRLVLRRAATLTKNGRRRSLGVHDVTCAFLHASMEGEPPIFLSLPGKLAPPGAKAKLRVSLYGTRRASFLWGEKASEVLCSSGCVRLKQCGQVFWNANRHLSPSCGMHGAMRW